MKVKITKDKKGTAIGGGGGVGEAGFEGRVHVTDCSDINIVIQSISLDFVAPLSAFRTGTAGSIHI